MKLCISFLLIGYIFIQGLEAQPDLEWFARYNGSHGVSEGSNDIKIDASGNVYVTGRSDSVSSTGIDIVTIKYKPDGTMEWMRTYNFAGLTDVGLFLEIDPYGFIYVVGTVSVNFTNQDIIVIKYKPSGSMIWAKRFAPPGYLANGNDTPFSVTIDNNYIYIAGSITEDAPYNKKQMVLFRSNFNAGYTSAVYGLLGKDDYGHQVEADITGNMYICGLTQGTATSEKGVVIKYNTSMIPLWTRIIEDTLKPKTKVYRMDLNSLGKVIVAGTADSVTTTRPNCILSALNPADGSISWYRRIAAPGLSFGLNPLSIDDEDNIILGTTYTELVTYARRSKVYKYNAGGNYLWSKRVDSIYNIHGMCTDPSSNIYVSGFPLGDGKFLAKLSPAGSIEWYGSVPYAVDGWKLEFINTDKLYVAGVYSNVSGNRDFLTVKYNISSLSKPSIKGIVSEYRLERNFPNPFNPVTSIRFSIPVYSSAVLRVYDNIGREVAVLVNGNLELGEHEVTFDASGLSSGIYFYKLESGKYSEIRKMVLVK